MRLKVFILALLFLFILASCSTNQTQDQPSPSTDTLTKPTDNEDKTYFNPYNHATESDGEHVFYSVLSGIYKISGLLF